MSIPSQHFTTIKVGDLAQLGERATEDRTVPSSILGVPTLVSWPSGLRRRTQVAVSKEAGCLWKVRADYI
ncbi:hypothetical protein BB560_000605 [Smittium megazygosporum]|uniref:Uncharacterized protein n=1 Tax=Smittium megazygosporum TaxID=133381 RepID=A0A2T9ZJT2_9FUNG|nr:hypothetical protein BB560_000605 [Smittium megazygosporum]